MEILDILIIIVAIAAIIRGYAAGLISRIGSLAAIILAIVASRLFGPAVYERWGASVAPDHSTLVLIVSYAIVFAICYFGIRFAARLVRGAIRTIRLGIIDSLCGALFSLFEWMIAISIAMNLYAALAPSGADIFTGSGHFIRALVYNLAPAVIGYIQKLHIVA
ncbi:MAG: CvpA family protein [Muribaculaceae bacterium]|nr:CvpA family protein [Muribaculaceae bacterium]